MTPNEIAIRTTVAVVTANSGDPSPLIAMAKRESNFNHLAIGDTGIAAEVFQRRKAKIKENGSPWTDDASLWSGSLGLFQLMAPYEVQWWRPDAHPSVLHHPVASTILAMRKWNRILSLGAKTPVDVRMVWAYGPDGLKISHSDPRYIERVESERKRWRALGLPGDPATMPAQRYHGAGLGGETADQQGQLVEASRRLGIAPGAVPPREWEPSQPVQPPTTTHPRGGGASALGVIAALVSAFLLSRLA